MVIDVAILLSVGVHPLSGRPRRAELDARAVELALRLAAGPSGVRLHALHAGNPNEASLRDYLGMGLDRLTVLELPGDGDPLPPLTQHLAKLKPAITLAGLHSEGGEGSGFLPYALAEALGLTLAPAIADLAWEGEGEAVRLEQALRGGQRRALACPIPVIATIDKAAPAPRQSAYGKARRGAIATLPAAEAADPWRALWRAGPSRRRGHLAAATGSVAERLAAITGAQAAREPKLLRATPEEAAKAIDSFLRAKGLRGGAAGSAASAALPSSATGEPP